ncbi:FtsH protease activity modulator HflK [Antarcticirhabdus aurantiaca]|uniref:FtsH protease activity modulator HflK n=1 Tax=Antarcticirhabdus aurantiaca TaxID=2606717 RepID=A0ACD4NI43_9HYPH|nr:FtsH protease activity modulator HflK [Antarcticirhabdus aurantiaca]WAJ26493.1 FtsH protease activity modulator HflK [Jeongeuplla avenae]
MPWSNQTGNGGWKGGGGGPWGQGPQPPRPGNNNGSPDLEDILRRGQDRLRRAMPGGGGRGGPSGQGGGLALGGLVVAGLLVLWGFQSIYTVQPDEVGVEMLFGKPKEELSQPGLHFAFWPLETVDTVPVTENQIQIGGRGTSGNSANQTAGLMLSGDQNIVDVQFAVLYQVDNPQNFLFNVEDPTAMVQQVSESAMREVVGRRPVQDVFRDDRAGIAEEVRAITQDTLNQYGTGIRINAISIEDASPPDQVADAFDEVQRAEQNEDQFIEEANLYRNQQLGRAQGEAAQIREDAAAYRNRVIQLAEGEAERFSQILAEYEKAPEITRKRIFLETMENVLGNSAKVIVENGAAGASGIVPYLPLNELPQGNRQAPNQAPQGTTGAPRLPNSPSATNSSISTQGAN